MLLKSLNLHFVITLMFRIEWYTYFSEIRKKIKLNLKKKSSILKSACPFFSYFLGLAIDTLFDRGGAGVHCYQF